MPRVQVWLSDRAIPGRFSLNKDIRFIQSSDAIVLTIDVYIAKSG